MSPIKISIDLNQSPIRIGGLIIGKFIVARGSKGVKVGSSGAKDKEVVEIYNDANNVVKSFFGAPKFDAVVVIVPNNTSREHRDQIGRYGQTSGFNVTQVIQEYVAVAVAYAEKARPSEETKLAIISLNSGILDVSIISVVPNAGSAVKFRYVYYDNKAHPEPIEFEKQEGGHHSDGGLLGLMGSAVKTLVVDPFETAINVLKSLLGDIKIGHRGVDKVVLVGKAARSDKLHEEVKKTFPDAEVWSGFDEGEEVAAYGGAVLSSHDTRITLEDVREHGGDGEAGFGS